MSSTDTSDYDRTKIDTQSDDRSRLRRTVDVLQETLTQSVETISRSARLKVARGAVDDIDPPDGIDQYHDLYKEVGLIRANLNQFVSDVVKPGVRVEADDDATAAYFMGEDEDESVSIDIPEGGFLSQAFVVAGEKRQPFYSGLKNTILNRWTRGTILHEFLKDNADDPESQITGFTHIPPETVSARTLKNTNILLPPDPSDLPPEVSEEDVTLTKRDEVAAFVQFDEQSILGRRNDGFSEKEEIVLSQNDVMKQTLDPDIGGDDSNEQGVFGTSILEAVATDAKEYQHIKRDRAEAIKRKAYGIWLAEFKEQALDLGHETQIVSWGDESQSDFEDQLADMGPGDVLFADGPVELQEFEANVPELGETLSHYVDDILTPLPAPKYTVGFETDINQFVTQQQDERYERVIQEERQYQERQWSSALRLVAERHPDLNPEGVNLVIEPEEDDSPIMSLDEDDIGRIETFAGAMKDLFGPGGAPSFVNEETLLELVLQLPEDAIADTPDGVEQALDEADDDVQAQFNRQMSEDTEEEEGA